MDPTIGTIMLFAGNFAPRSWSFCDGQLLAISSNTALFSIIGTTYGGDGRTSFALPDLRGRAPIGPRRGPGLSDRPLGQRSGIEEVTLNLLQLPMHTHFTTLGGTLGLTGSATATMATNDSAGTDSSDNTFLADNGGGDGFAASAGTTTLNANAIDVDTTGLSIGGNLTVTNSHTGGSQPHANMQPFIAVNYIIAMFGIYPSRS